MRCRSIFPEQLLIAGLIIVNVGDRRHLAEFDMTVQHHHVAAAGMDGPGTMIRFGCSVFPREVDLGCFCVHQQETPAGRLQFRQENTDPVPDGFPVGPERIFGGSPGDLGLCRTGEFHVFVLRGYQAEIGNVAAGAFVNIR